MMNETVDREPFVDQDSPLAAFASFVLGLADTGLQMQDSQTGLTLSVESTVVDLPVEIGIGFDNDEKVQLTGAPPTQHLETTIMPVFHRLKLKIVRDQSD